MWVNKSEKLGVPQSWGQALASFTSRSPSRVSEKGQESPLMVLVGEGKGGCQDPEAG